MTTTEPSNDTTTLLVRYTNLIAERDRLSASVDELLNRNTTLAADHDLLTGRLSHAVAEQEQAARDLIDMTTQHNVALRAERRANDELTEFKEQVVAVAGRYADDNDWCTVVDRALEELGLERERKRYSGTLTITVGFSAQLAAGRRETPGRSWVRDSMRNLGDIRTAINNLEFDGDHESGEVDDIEFEVTNIEDND